MIFALHGNLGSADDWKGCGLEVMGGSLQAVDLWHEVESGLGLEAWAKNFCASVQARCGENEKPWLAGYSLGGRLALHALLEAPDFWGGAAIISANPGLADEGERERRRRRDAEWVEQARDGDWEKFLSEWNAQPVFAGNPGTAILERQRALQSRRESVARAFELWSLGQQADLSDPLSACDLPALWVNGGTDRKFVELGAAMADAMPGGEHLVIEDRGHRLLDEAPSEVGTAIGDFQKRNL